VFAPGLASRSAWPWLHRLLPGPVPETGGEADRRDGQAWRNRKGSTLRSLNPVEGGFPAAGLAGERLLRGVSGLTGSELSPGTVRASGCLAALWWCWRSWSSVLRQGRATSLSPSRGRGGFWLLPDRFPLPAAPAFPPCVGAGPRGLCRRARSRLCASCPLRQSCRRWPEPAFVQSTSPGSAQHAAPVAVCAALARSGSASAGGCKSPV